MNSIKESKTLMRSSSNMQDENKKRLYKELSVPQKKEVNLTEVRNTIQSVDSK